jgi:RND superfamily putative drug exporter
MKLLGGWNWWMPSWLDRVLPRLNFEDRHEPEPAEA